jgi:hypothetical protein
MFESITCFLGLWDCGQAVAFRDHIRSTNILGVHSQDLLPRTLVFVARNLASLKLNYIHLRVIQFTPFHFCRLMVLNAAKRCLNIKGLPLRIEDLDQVEMRCSHRDDHRAEFGLKRWDFL